VFPKADSCYSKGLQKPWQNPHESDSYTYLEY
jgi:hypothetical protein